MYRRTKQQSYVNEYTYKITNLRQCVDDRNKRTKTNLRQCVDKRNRRTK
jgi:hypothetical protein